MGRFWIGVGLLIGLLVLGFGVSSAMDSAHREIADTLEQAAQAVFSGEVEEGVSQAEQAQRKWESCWKATASAADHEPMDEIDSLFAQMEMYRKFGDQTEFAACCRRLSQLVRAVGEAHAFNWWNLL